MPNEYFENPFPGLDYDLLSESRNAYCDIGLGRSKILTTTLPRLCGSIAYPILRIIELVPGQLSSEMFSLSKHLSTAQGRDLVELVLLICAPSSYDSRELEANESVESCFWAARGLPGYRALFTFEHLRYITIKMQEEIEKYNEKNLKVVYSILNKESSDDYTVYTGTAGIALLHLLYALKHDDISRECYMRAFDLLELKNLKGKRISFLCGDAGPLAIAAVITYKLGPSLPSNLPDHKTYIKRLIDLMPLVQKSPDEILYGKSGYLYALLFVKKYTNDNVVPTEHIEWVVAEIIKCGRLFAKESKSDSRLLWQWHEKIYLGGAHGVAGILYMLLQAKEYYSDKVLMDYVKPSICWLLDQQLPSGNFDSSLESRHSDRLIQWCHGAPGYSALFILAHQIFGDEGYYKAAIKCGEVAWRRGISRKGYSICHGVSGNAYTFLQLYQATKDPRHLYRAACFAKWCLEEREGTQLRFPDRPASLFEGVAGRLYFLEEIKDPLNAKFPAFTLDSFQLINSEPSQPLLL